jgi:hypothetical protein
VTVVPFVTVSVAGLNAKLSIFTVLGDGLAASAAKAAGATGSSASAAHRSGTAGVMTLNRRTMRGATAFTKDFIGFSRIS